MLQFGVDTIEGSFVKCNVSEVVENNDTEVGQRGETADTKSGKSESKRAMELRYIQKPQDGSADARVNLDVAPAFVTYNAKALANVMTFFRTDEVEYTR